MSRVVKKRNRKFQLSLSEVATIAVFFIFLITGNLKIII
ncbi:hypothetical protein LEP1GSC089_1300 [Leptospira interrogans serovar Autumnalis str. LP101]|nr:hypothetical protein LEP1GSC089_1300 [Leptospira interrogans serovar Autumnalis str. LP101]EMN65032.1 hypothetical protein LEP1GSC098_1678 [Leptospira interrogans serovar Grippotyphosa str. UI 08434]